MTHAKPFTLNECNEVIQRVRREPDYIRQISYYFDEFHLIKHWHTQQCTLIVYRDRDERPPPYDITFSFEEIVYIYLRIMDKCQVTGRGGIAEVGNGYEVAVGNADTMPGRMKPVLAASA